MNRRRLLLIVVAAVAVVVLTFLLTQTTFIQEVIAPPIYILYVVVITFLDSLPQLLFWFVFMLFVLQLLLTTLLQYVGAWLGQRRDDRPIESEALPGAVEKYTRWIEQEHLGPFFKWRVRQRVMELSLHVIGRNEPIPLRELEQHLEENSFNLPAGALSYLKGGIQAREEDRKPRRKSLLPHSQKSEIDHTDLKAMLDYLEEVLEI